MLDGAARLGELFEAAAQHGHAGHRHHRPRLRLRRLRLLEAGHRSTASSRSSASRPTSRPAPTARQDPGPLGRRRAATTSPARGAYTHMTLLAGTTSGMHNLFRHVVAGLARGPLLQAPHGPRAAADLLRRPDRHDRLPVRRGPDPAPARPVRRGRRGGRRVPGHLRRGELLRRAHGPRARHRAARHERPAAAGQGPRPAAGRHQRPALHPRRGRQGPRGAAVRAVRLDPDATPTGSSSTPTSSTSSPPREMRDLSATSPRPATTRC